MNNDKQYWDKRWEELGNTPDNFTNYVGKMGDFVKLNLKTLKSSIDSLKIKNKTILDIGGGKGYSLHFLFNASNKKELFDISSQAIEYARKHLSLKANVFDICKDDVSFYKNKYDVICLFEVVEHLHPLDNSNVTNKIYDMLKKDGILIITTPNLTSITSRIKMLFGLKPNIFTVDPTHINPFRIKDVKILLGGKFNIIDIFTTKMQIPIKRQKYITLPFSLNLGETIIAIAKKNEI